MLEKNSILPFLCKQTGKCCVNNLVPLSPFDIFRLSKYLNFYAKELFEMKLLSYKITTSTYFMEPVIQINSQNVCPFLKQENTKYLCSIYEARPFACRIFPLKYDPDHDKFLRNQNSEARCIECTLNENETSLQAYMEENLFQDKTHEFTKYRNLVEKISLQGFNLKELAGKKEKQKVFFHIQSLLYETYPNEENSTEYPWDKVEKEILRLINQTC